MVVSKARPTRVKICGITSLDALDLATGAGADAIGLVFYPPSPRHIEDLSLASRLCDAAGPFVSVVGLFVDPEPDYVQRVLADVRLSLLQFHGHENDAFCRSFGRPYLKALRMKPGIDVAVEMDKYEAAVGILLDAYRPGVPGGTGETFDWQRIPAVCSKPIVLAGGLNPGNVVEAITAVSPWAVDVSGGVESAPGVKNPQLVEAFVHRAKFFNIPVTGE